MNAISGTDSTRRTYARHVYCTYVHNNLQLFYSPVSDPTPGTSLFVTRRAKVHGEYMREMHVMAEGETADESTW